MCVVADTDSKVGRTKIDPRGKISLFVGYSTQHAGDDAKYAKHLKLFGEMCVVADTDNKVGRQIQIIKLGGPRLIPQARSVYLLGTAPNMQEMSTGS